MVVLIHDTILSTVARIGFVPGASRTVSEDTGEVILLIESDGSNVDPVNVSYSLSGSGIARGSMSLKTTFYGGIFISLSPSLPRWL